MLSEIPHIRQENRRLTKRWFTSSEMELFVWLQDSAPVRLQLCIDKQNHEQAIDRGYHHGFRFYTVEHDQSICGESISYESLAYECEDRQASPRRLKVMNDVMRAGHRPGKHPAAT